MEVIGIVRNGAAKENVEHLTHTETAQEGDTITVVIMTDVFFIKIPILIPNTS